MVIPAGLHIESCIQHAEPIRASIVEMNTKGLRSELLLHCQVLPIPCSCHLCPPEGMQKQRSQQGVGSRVLSRTAPRYGKPHQKRRKHNQGSTECKKTPGPPTPRFYEHQSTRSRVGPPHSLRHLFLTFRKVNICTCTCPSTQAHALLCTYTRSQPYAFIHSFSKY